jgi:hypothetical protein
MKTPQYLVKVNALREEKRLTRDKAESAEKRKMKNNSAVNILMGLLCVLCGLRCELLPNRFGKSELFGSSFRIQIGATAGGLIRTTPTAATATTNDLTGHWYFNPEYHDPDRVAPD